MKVKYSCQDSYGFNGHEKDDEITDVTGATNTAMFWEYDTRLGRRWNMDPKPTIGISDYSVFGGNPIANIDLLGDRWKTTHDKKQADKMKKHMETKRDEYKAEYDKKSEQINNFAGDPADMQKLIEERDEAQKGQWNMQRGIGELAEMDKTEDALFTFKYQFTEKHPEVSVSKITAGNDKGKLLFTLNYAWGDFSNRAHETQHGYDLWKGKLTPLWKPNQTSTTDFLMTPDQHWKLEERAYMRQYFYDKAALQFVNINKLAEITRDKVRTLHPAYKF